MKPYYNRAPVERTVRLEINMTDWIKVAMYNAWLLEMYNKGYGSTDQIDKRVSKGELTPGKEYEKISKVPNAELTGRGAPVERRVRHI